MEFQPLLKIFHRPEKIIISTIYEAWQNKQARIYNHDETETEAFLQKAKIRL